MPATNPAPLGMDSTAFRIKATGACLPIRLPKIITAGPNGARWPGVPEQSRAQEAWPQSPSSEMARRPSYSTGRPDYTLKCRAPDAENHRQVRQRRMAGVAKPRLSSQMSKEKTAMGEFPKGVSSSRCGRLLRFDASFFLSVLTSRPPAWTKQSGRPQFP